MRDYVSDKEPREWRGRIIIPICIVIFAFSILAIRLWYLQVIEGPRYKGLSQNNRVRLVHTTAPRGLIFDRNGTILAENRPGFDLLVVPEDVTDWDETKRALTKLVEITPEKIDERLKKAKKRPPFQSVKLKGDLKWEEMVRVENAKFRLPGVVLAVGPKRVYPFKAAAAHLVGYLGEISEKELKTLRAEGGIPYRGGDMTGKYGVERILEDALKGKDGGRHVEVDALGRELRVLKNYPPYPGNNIHLTIDMPTQITAARVMEGKAGAVVAIEPSTGQILALVSSPAFDPNTLNAGLSVEEWNEILKNPMDILTNRAIQGQYPPASTFKIITAAAALNERVITPYKKIFSGPTYNFSGRDYRDWKEEGHGNINVYSAIVESSDTFFYQLGLETGIEHISSYASGFGLGKKTGIRLLNEKDGLVPSNEWKLKAIGERWYQGETLSVSVGQGFLLATPIQLANAYSAIANGGTILRPKLIMEISTPGGEPIERFFPEETAKLKLSEKTLKIIKKALRGVVADPDGTARGLWYAKLGIAGKTGTAQVATSTERIDDIETVPYKIRDHAWFVGYAPYDDPKIAVAVLVEHGGFGSRTAAPLAREVIKTYLAGLKIKRELVKEKEDPAGVSTTEAGRVIKEKKAGRLAARAVAVAEGG